MHKLNLLTLLVLSQLLVINRVVFCLPLGDTEGDDDTAADEKPADFNTNQVPEQFRDLLGNDDEDEDDDDDDRDFCSICYDDYIKKPPFEPQCGHIFHLDCLEQFQVVSPVKLDKCFICTKPLRTKNGDEIMELVRAKERAAVRMKFKIGYLAGYKPKPLTWKKLPKYQWSIFTLFNAENEKELALQRDFD